MNKNIYLLYGEEPYLIEEEIKIIASSVLEPSEKAIKYDMTEDDLSNALEDLNTTSLFGNSKVIVCNNCYFLTSKSNDIEQDVSELTMLLDKELDSILILTVDYKLDERKKVVKELLKKSNIKCFGKLKEYELINFIEKKFNEYKIDINVIKYFLSYVGSDLGIIMSEIEKLKLYKEEKIITIEDIDNISSKALNDNIFDLVDAVVNKDVNRALSIYDDLIILNEEEIKLIVVIANQFRLIYQTKTMYKSGYSESDISKHLGVHPYKVKLANQIFIKENEVLKYLNLLADLDIKIKTGELEKSYAFKMFLIGI
jgi:DNA polymerase-3 subunit delta